MKTQVGTYLWKGSDKKEINDVRKYWTSNVNTTQFWTGDPCEIGSPKFFQEVSHFIKTNYKHRYKLIDEVSAKYPGGSLLEVGCGAGWELIYWAQKGLNVQGMDLSSTAIKLAKENFRYNNLSADFKEGNAEELPYEDNSFDVVASFGVLHQTKNTQKAIHEVNRVLKPGGMAVMTFYYKYSWKIFLTKLAHVNFEFEHKDSPITRLYDKKDLEILYKQFDKIHIYVDGYTATNTLRNGLKAYLYKKLFRPVFNLFPVTIREKVGHAIIITALKSCLVPILLNPYPGFF